MGALSLGSYTIIDRQYQGMDFYEKSIKFFLNVSNKVLEKNISPLKYYGFKKNKGVMYGMENVEQHIQSEYIRNADMNELVVML